MVGCGEDRRGNGGWNAGHAVATDLAGGSGRADGRLVEARGESCMIQTFPD